MAATVTLLGALAAGNDQARAQAPYQQTLLPGFTSLDVGEWSNPDFVDLDADGDFDAVVGELAGLRYFANTGSSATPAFVEMTGTANPFSGLEVGSYSHPALVDLDGDGDLDAAVGELAGALRFLANTGSSATPGFLELTGTANPFDGFDVGVASNPVLEDLDGDGDLDAVVGERLCSLRYFVNSGSSAAPAFFALTGNANPFGRLDVGFGCSPDLGDLDGDGDLDAVVGEDFGRLRYFANTGSSTTPAFLELTGTANPFDDLEVGYSSSPDLVDVDADGDLDAIVGEFYGSLRHLANTGSSATPAFVAVAGTASPFDGLDLGGFSGPEAVDLDGDGDLDAIVGEILGSLRTFANTGSSTTPAFVALTGLDNPFDDFDVGQSSKPDLADLDGDGDPDAVAGERFGSLRYYVNAGSATAAAFLELTGSNNPFAAIDVGDYSSPALADLDGDGDLDAVAGDGAGTLRYFANSGSSAAAAFLEITGSDNPFAGTTTSGFASPDFADFDGDGDLDAVAGDSSGGVLYFDNTGSSTAAAFVELAGLDNPFTGIDVGRRSCPALADLDSDGDLDALVGESGGRVVFFRSLDADVFHDGFEGGDTSAWSATVPGP